VALTPGHLKSEKEKNIYYYNPKQLKNFYDLLKTILMHHFNQEEEYKKKFCCPKLNEIIT
jgi:hypothetical protein